MRLMIEAATYSVPARSRVRLADLMLRDRVTQRQQFSAFSTRHFLCVFGLTLSREITTSRSTAAVAREAHDAARSTLPSLGLSAAYSCTAPARMTQTPPPLESCCCGHTHLHRTGLVPPPTATQLAQLRRSVRLPRRPPGREYASRRASLRGTLRDHSKYDHCSVATTPLPGRH